LGGFVKEVSAWCEADSASNIKAERLPALTAAITQWQSLTQEIGMKALQNPEEVGAASFDYLMFSGYVVLAYLWLRAAEVAELKMDGSDEDVDFYTAKLETTRFYFDRILPRIHTLAATISVGAGSLMAMDESRFVVGLDID